MNFDHLDDTTFDPDGRFRRQVSSRVDQLVRRRRAVLTATLVTPLVAFGAVAIALSTHDGNADDLVVSGDRTETSVPTTLPPAVVATTAPVASSAPTPIAASPTSTSPTGAPATGAPATSTSTTSTSPTGAPTTTAPRITDPGQAPIELRYDGLGPLRFGDPAGGVISTLADTFGTPDVDASMEYPVPDPFWGYTGDGLAFDHPFGRTVCFAEMLCTHFGGPGPESLALVGWELRSNLWPGDPAWTPGSLGLATPSGVMLGSVVVDHLAVIEVEPFGCFTTGQGTVDGIRASLYASTGWFLTNDDQDPTVPSPPDPAAMIVYALSAGSSPVDTADDC